MQVLMGLAAVSPIARSERIAVNSRNTVWLAAMSRPVTAAVAPLAAAATEAVLDVSDAWRLEMMAACWASSSVSLDVEAVISDCTSTMAALERLCTSTMAALERLSA